MVFTLLHLILVPAWASSACPRHAWEAATVSFRQHRFHEVSTAQEMNRLLHYFESRYRKPAVRLSITPETDPLEQLNELSAHVLSKKVHVSSFAEGLMTLAGHPFFVGVEIDPRVDESHPSWKVWAPWLSAVSMRPSNSAKIILLRKN